MTFLFPVADDYDDVDDDKTFQMLTRALYLARTFWLLGQNSPRVVGLTPHSFYCHSHQQYIGILDTLRTRSLFWVLQACALNNSTCLSVC